METRNTFWLETYEILARWVGVGVAAVLSGILLGILEINGIHEKAALIVASAVGFILAVIFWIIIAGRFKTEPVECGVGMSTNELSIEGGQAQSFAFAAAVVCLSLYTCVPVNGANPTMIRTASGYHAIPEL